jgi:hypothetical protein
MKKLEMGLILSWIAILALLSFVIYDKKTQKPIVVRELYSNNQPFSVEVPLEMDFCGEKVPLHDPEVFERFERELLVNAYMHANTFMIIKRSREVLPVIERILIEQNIPLDFKYLAAAESSFNPIAVSSAKAVGYWQFIESTAQMMDLEITDEVDFRQDLEASTLAACKFLRQAYERFGSWTTAAICYNMGMANMKDAIQTQKQTDYYNIKLQSEPSRYIFRILAFKEILGNEKKYGYNVSLHSDKPKISTKSLEITQSIPDLIDFAQSQGTSYKMLRYLNPWLKGKSLKVKGKTYIIKVPNS